MYTATSPKTLAAAALALLGTVPPAALAHMIMAEPPPFGGADLDNSPLTGANFPCKVKGDPKAFFKRYKVTTVAVGEKHPLSFKGSAVHGGGSCQLAVTKDLEPTAGSHWQVILSIHGGCPSTDGQGPSTYEWSVPAQVAPGDYVFQWSWISKMAGQPEFYQNCAALTVTGGKAKTKRHDGSGEEEEAGAGYEHGYGNETLAGSEMFARDDKLPDLWVGNMGPTINQCKSTPSTDPIYPDPGPNVITPGKGKMAFAKLTGNDCVPGNKQATGGSSPASSGGSSGGSSGDSSGGSSGGSSGASSVGSSGGSSSGGGNDGQYHGEGSSGGSGSSGSSGSGSGSGSSGSGSGSSSSAASAAPSSAPAAGATPSGFMTSIAAASASASASSAPAAAAPSSEAGSSSGGSSGSSDSGSAPAAPASAPAGGASGGENGACTEEGIYNCIGGSSFQRCASGKWTALEPMPGGTKCAEGKSNNLWARGDAMMMMRRRRV